MDNFIEQILQKTKNTLSLALALSVSAIALAPLAIGLSIFLLLHPSFFLVLEKESEFGLFLSILLVGIVIVSLIWLVIGIKQYRSIKLWNKRYSLFIKRKEEIDKNVAAEYDLDLDQDYQKCLIVLQDTATSAYIFYGETLSHKALWNMAAKFYPFPVGLYAVIGFSRLTVETYLSGWHIIYEEFLVPLLLLLLFIIPCHFVTERRKSLFKNTQRD